MSLQQEILKSLQELSAGQAANHQAIIDLRRDLLGNGQPGRIQKIEESFTSHVAGHATESTLARRRRWAVYVAILTAIMALGVAVADNFHEKALAQPSITQQSK